VVGGVGWHVAVGRYDCVGGVGRGIAVGRYDCVGGVGRGYQHHQPATSAVRLRALCHSEGTGAFQKRTS